MHFIGEVHCHCKFDQKVNAEPIATLRHYGATYSYTSQSVRSAQSTLVQQTVYNIIHNVYLEWSHWGQCRSLFWSGLHLQCTLPYMFHLVVLVSHRQRALDEWWQSTKGTRELNVNVMFFLFIYYYFRTKRKMMHKKPCNEVPSILLTFDTLLAFQSLLLAK